MNRRLINSLPDAERLLIAETEPAALAELDEDGLVELHARIQRARNKYVKLYRREASARVATVGGRGAARPKNRRNAERAEVFEDALSRVSTKLAAAARRTAAELRAERIEAARAAKSGGAPAPEPASDHAVTPRGRGRAAANPATGARPTTTPRTQKSRAGARASNARSQARRDSRGR